MTTIYIDSNLTPRYSPNGWPEVPPVKASIYADTFAVQSYEKALAKAKADSIELECHTIFYPILNACTPPDSFIDVEIGEVEVCYQWMGSGGWIDCGLGEFNGRKGHGYKTRTVARVKKQENAARLDSAGELIPEGHTQCPRCFGCGETAPNVECKKCQGSGFIPEVGMVTTPACPPGLKAKILNLFEKRYRGADYSRAVLGDVLDELKIK